MIKREKIISIFWSILDISRVKFLELKAWFFKLSWDRKVAFVIFVGLLTYLPFFFFPNNDELKTTKEVSRFVEIINVGDISNVSSPLSLVGVVESLSEATVRAEGSGQLTRVYKKLGDKVYAGETIATFENSSERASVTQAEGAYEQAKAGRDISKINNSQSINSIEAANANALNTISSAFVTMDDAIRTKTDIAFTNPRQYSARFDVLVPNQTLIYNIETTRQNLEKVLTKREEINKVINVSNDLENELDEVKKELNLVKNYLDELAVAYSAALPTQVFSQAQIDSQKAIIGGLRAQLSGTISGVTGVKQALVSSKNSGKISLGEKNPSIASSDASVKIALGSYQAAISRLQKTIVRSSISGTINSLSVKTGDYASPGQTMAIISNNNALEVTTNISLEDVKKVVIGQEVLINQKISGVVTRVASAIDPLTKKVEVKIGIKDETIKLTNGQSVRIEIKGVSPVKLVRNSKEKISLSLSSVKMTPRGTFVFIVNAENILESIKIEIGSLSGNEVEVLSGLSNEINIVKDARGLKEGDLVEIENINLELVK